MSIYDKKSIPQLIQIAQKHFNAYIRARDAKDGYFICISCNTPKILEKMQAGHYLSAGHHSYLRFNPENVHGQCIRCNMHLHGNPTNYRINLIRKIGQETVEALEATMHTSIKQDRFTLMEIIEKYKSLVKQAA